MSLRFGFFVMEKIPLDLLAFGVPRSLTTNNRCQQFNGLADELK